MSKIKLTETVATAVNLLGALRFLKTNSSRVSAAFGYTLSRNIAALEPIEKAFLDALQESQSELITSAEPERLAIVSRYTDETTGQLDDAAANLAWQEYLGANPDLIAALSARAEHIKELETTKETFEVRMLPLAAFPNDLDPGIWDVLHLVVQD